METIDTKGVIYEFGNFVLNPEEKTLFASGKALRLPAKEFDTLLFLIEHNGKALSKEELMTAVWRDAFVEEGNLAKQISRLRKILNTDGEEFIETIPKHGYRFNANLRMMTVDETPLILERQTVNKLTVAYEDGLEERPLPAAGRSIFTWKRVALLALAGVVVAGIWFWYRQLQAAKTVHTIAVLPLRPLGEDETGTELGLGLTDALIIKLGSLKRVVVRPTNAVSSFVAGTDPIEFGRKLNVDAVLEGTIQRSEGRLRINARLLRISNGEQIWADRFDQPTAGLFALQDSLSVSIARALAFELNRSDSDSLSRRGTNDPEAYEAYLRGRFFQSQNTSDGLNKSLVLFQQAAMLDPKFAEAYAGMADANILLFNFGLSSKDVTIPKAREAVKQALQLNPDLSNAHTSNALIQFLVDRDWPAAEKSLQRAIELNPNNADAFLRYGYFLINAGRFDEALEKLEMARQLNPLSGIVNADIGLAYLCARRHNEAVIQLEKTATENPRFSLPYWLLGTVYETLGDENKAFEANYTAFVNETSPDDPILAELKKVHDEQGTEAANKWWFDATVRDQKKFNIPSIVVASRAATIKDREQTLLWLSKAIDDGDPSIAQIRYLANYDFVRDDPRFQAIVDKLTY